MLQMHRRVALSYLSSVIARSLRGPGAGPCLGTLGGLCLDIARPVAVHATGTADDLGVATLELTLPGFVPPGASVSLQAVVRRGDSGLLWQKSAPVTRVIETARPVSDLPPGSLVITEFMSQPSAPGGEWIELYNATDDAVDLEGLRVSAGGELRLGPAYVPAGAYVLLAASADPAVNGGLPPVAAAWGGALSLSDSYGEILLLGDGVLDSVGWDDGDAWPLEPGVSTAFSAEPDARDNDRGDGWCGEYARYGDGDRGTPGRASLCIPGATLYLAESRGGATGLWAFDTTHRELTFIGDPGVPLTALAFGPDGRLFGVTGAIGARGGTVVEVNPRDASIRDIYDHERP
ncbi:MAG: hypothetical protein ACI8PZ_005288 [Myxococcota bacterium]|jgi:hypothetical protein